MEYIIRKAWEFDKEFLLELRKVTMTEYLEGMNILLSEQEHMQRVDSFFDDSYIIEDNSRNKIWLLKYTEDVNILELIQLQILPEFQNKWIGSKVLDALIIKSQKSAKKCILKVLKNNPAITLYQRKGFQVVWEDDIEYHMAGSN